MSTEHNDLGDFDTQRASQNINELMVNVVTLISLLAQKGVFTMEEFTKEKMVSLAAMDQAFAEHRDKGEA